jgi:hypothetical protein
MYKKCLLLLAFSIVFLGCSRKTELAISAASFSEDELSLCKEVSCPEISVDYISFSGTAEIADKINTAIRKFIIASLYIGDADSAPTAETVSEAGIQFIEMYRTHSAEFPDMQMEYFADIDIQETYLSKTMVSIEMHHYLFTGGAHGYGATFFVNFDTQTGLEIPVEDLFEDYDKFEKLAEEKFRIANNIPLTEPINSTGFWFENDIFYLPEAIGFTDSHMVLIYNPYDIASYAAGPVELQIPKEEVIPYLTNTYR